jgi:DNA gyrase subunit A
VVKRIEFDLAKAEAREHILEGLKIAVDNIDEVVAIIRGSEDTEEASVRLRQRFELSEVQADAILQMRLGRLTGLEMAKLDAELEEVRASIAELQEILGSRERRFEIIVEELEEVARKFGDDRRSEIIGDVSSFNIEDLIVEEDMVLTVSHQGYIKRIGVDTYRSQRRGGRGLQGMGTKEEDWVEHLFVASTHDVIMIFTRDGQCRWLKVWQIPQAGRSSRGKPIVNLLNVSEDEQIAAVVPVREFRDDQYLFFCTRNGVVKKTALSAYGNMRSVSLNAINIREGDELIDVQITDGDNEVVLATRNGKAIHFKEQDARSMGRATGGVRGIDLSDDDRVVGMVVTRREGATLLVVAENGMGKRSDIDAYRLQKRGGKGVINLKTSEKTGKVISIKGVLDTDEVMLITRKGVINRQRIAEIRVIGRATQGVKLMNLDDGDVVMDVARVIPDEDTDAAEGPADSGEVAEATAGDAEAE